MWTDTSERLKYYNYYICLTAFFQDNLGKPAPALDFTGARDGVAAASAGPCTNHLHLAPDR